MELSEIIGKSLTVYKANPVLFVPAFVAFIVSILTSAILPRDVSREGVPAITSDLVMVGFGVIFLMLVVSFLVILGQASMSGKAIKEGKTALGDWGVGVRKYFFRVFGIGLVFLGIVLILFMIVGVVYVLTVLPEMITSEGVMRPPITSAPQTTYMSWVMTLVMTVASSFFYLWLAPAVLDNKGVGASLDMGVKTIRSSSKVFVGFVILFFIVSAISTAIQNLPSMIGLDVQPIIGSLTFTSILSQIIERVFSPLWFLMAFSICREYSIHAS
jgi:hypothetical protein